MQRLAAGHQQRQTWASGKQFSQTAVPPPSCSRLSSTSNTDRSLSHCSSRATGARWAGSVSPSVSQIREGDQLGISDVAKADKPRAIAVVCANGFGDAQRKPRFATPTRARQGQQPRVVSPQQCQQLGQLASATHEWRRRHRQLDTRSRRRSRGWRGQRREVCAQPVDDELVEMLWPIQILQPVGTEVPQRNVVGKFTRHQLAGRARNQDLSAMSRRDRSAPPGEHPTRCSRPRAAPPRLCAPPSALAPRSPLASDPSQAPSARPPRRRPPHPPAQRPRRSCRPRCEPQRRRGSRTRYEAGAGAHPADRHSRGAAERAAASSLRCR